MKDNLYLKSNSWPFVEARLLLKKLNSKTPKKGFVLFTHRIDLWEKQDFLSILKKHQKTFKITKVSRPVNYLPFNNDFKNKIKIKIVLLQKY